MVILIFKMNKIIYILILICGDVLADKIDIKLHKLHNEALSNDNLKSRASEKITESTNILNNPDKSDEKSSDNAENDDGNSSTTVKTDEINNTDSLSDFDDLEYSQNNNTSEDDFVYVDSDAAGLGKEIPKIPNQSSSIPLIDAAVRAGKIQNIYTDGSYHSRSASNENSEVSHESKQERRMFNPVLVNHEPHRTDSVAPDYTHFGPPPNPLHMFRNNFGALANHQYSSTQYPPVSNGFLAPLHRFPLAQNSNPYNYMNKSPKSYEYPNSYENTNSYPYIGHRHKDPMPLMGHNVYETPHEYYRRIVPGILNSYSSSYTPSNTNNYGSQPFGHGRYV